MIPDHYSRPVKHSIKFPEYTTSISLEDCFWSALKHIAHERHQGINDLVAEIASEGRTGNLSSVIRQYILFDLRARALASGVPRSLPVLNGSAEVVP